MIYNLTIKIANELTHVIPWELFSCSLWKILMWNFIGDSNCYSYGHCGTSSKLEEYKSRHQSKVFAGDNKFAVKIFSYIKKSINLEMEWDNKKIKMIRQNKAYLTFDKPATESAFFFCAGLPGKYPALRVMLSFV